MVIPEGFLEKNKNAVEIEAISNSSEENSILHGWQIINIDSRGIDIKLDFNNPLAVSKGIEPDLLMVQLALADLKTEDSNIPMPKSVLKSAKIPAQMKDADEVLVVDTTATASSDTVASAIGSNYFLNFFFFGSMS